MKTINNLKILAAAAIVAGFSACDDIGPDDRFIEMPPVESKRVVLLEEFTGQKCVNCPNAHTIINSLIDQYPDNFIAVSIHSGGKANTYGEGEYSSIVGLRNDESEEYGQMWGVNAFPQGVVNRRSGLQTMDLWSTSIRSELERPARIEFNGLTATLSDDRSTIIIATDILPHDNFDARLQLWVVESGIVARQKLPDGSTDNSYVHNHVFRATVNGIEGEQVVFVTRESHQSIHQIALKESWNPDNLSIVAFVYTPDQGVEQAAETSLTTND